MAGQAPSLVEIFSKALHQNVEQAEQTLNAVTAEVHHLASLVQRLALPLTRYSALTQTECMHALPPLSRVFPCLAHFLILGLFPQPLSPAQAARAQIQFSLVADQVKRGNISGAACAPPPPPRRGLASKHPHVSFP